MNKFKFGDKVWHEEHGLGVVRMQIGDITLCLFENSTNSMAPTEKLTPASDWVKCSERLPKHGEMVLVFNGNSIEIDTLAIGEFDFECWCDSVTHWMPLPDRPTELAPKP